ncbi:MAG: prolipoprotein diacylglyceryl transferase [Thermoguttaceae bacterium]|nr:prolipoprotein diacylglyceryl transferase [Thermoguttaceae bacterium]MDW8039273.1 prolipoprotein diacylglyceryl transferase [Thermoguttaceae bacterium]
MHPTLLHIPKEIGGIPLFGFGLLFWVWVLGAGGWLSWLVWHQGWTQETRSFILLLVLVGAILVLLLPAICDQQGLPIRSYGTMVLFGVVVGLAVAVRRAKQIGLDAEYIFSLTFWIILCGIVGARLFYVGEYWEHFLRPSRESPEFWPTLGAIVNVAQGGLVVYGALLGAMVGLAGFWWKYRTVLQKNDVSLLGLADLVAPSLMFGLALGRVGCFLNGCCYGGLCDLPWAVRFPQGSLPYESQVHRGHMHGFSLIEHPKKPPIVIAVQQDGPAHQAGLSPGDQLAKVNSIPVQTSSQAQLEIAKAFYGQTPLRVETISGKQITIPSAPIPDQSLPVHPAQLYAAVNALMIGLFLLGYSPFCRWPGQLFAAMLGLYAVTRFLLEIIRTDEPGVWPLGLSISQNISVVLLIGVVIFWLVQARRYRSA